MPLIVAVPLPLSLNVRPSGSGAAAARGALMVVVTDTGRGHDIKAARLTDREAYLVGGGDGRALSTVRVKVWLADGSTPLLTVIVG